MHLLQSLLFRFLLLCWSFLFARCPVQKIHNFCTVVPQIELDDDFTANCDLRKLPNYVLYVDSMSFSSNFRFKPLYNNFVHLSQHCHTSNHSISHTYVSCHINIFTRLGANNVRVYSYTYEYRRHSRTQCVSHASFGSSTFNHHSTLGIYVQLGIDLNIFVVRTCIYSGRCNTPLTQQNFYVFQGLSICFVEDQRELLCREYVEGTTYVHRCDKGPTLNVHVYVFC